MRLLNVDTYQLREFVGRDIPPYAILSHRWEKEEVTFRDLQKGRAPNLLGWQKLRGCCRTAREDGHEWVWIDTCCIDKSSSAELSEAINSMFNWYAKAEVCYTYLSDVDKEDCVVGRSDPRPLIESPEGSLIPTSTWFSRGWTLQELIAPREMLFFDRRWNKLGTRNGLSNMIESVTGISKRDWNGWHQKSTVGQYRARSVAQRMSWASKRETTREEDMAYCLLGLFSVNMPLLYGEGGRKAFYRLQLEILQQSDDESLFAWDFHNDEHRERGGLLADRIGDFAHCRDIVRLNAVDRPSYAMTNKGLHIELPNATWYNRVPLGQQAPSRCITAPLNCARLFNGPYGTNKMGIYVCLGKTSQSLSDGHQSKSARWFRYDPEQWDHNRPSPAQLFTLHGMNLGSWEVYVRQHDYEDASLDSLNV